MESQIPSLALCGSLNHCTELFLVIWISVTLFNILVHFKKNENFEMQVFIGDALCRVWSHYVSLPSLTEGL